MAVACSVGAQTMSNDLYGELGYLGMKVSEGGTSVKPKMVRAVIGKQLDPNLAVEALVGLTLAKDEVGSGASKAEFSSTTYGVFVKPSFEIATDTALFARVGVAHTSLKQSNATRSSTGSTTKLAYGLGLQAQFNKNIYGQIDYTRYAKDNGTTVGGVTLSVGTRF